GHRLSRGPTAAGFRQLVRGAPAIRAGPRDGSRKALRRSHSAAGAVCDRALLVRPARLGGRASDARRTRARLRRLCPARWNRTLPLAALRPFQQPAAAVARQNDLPESFKVSIQPTVSGRSAIVTAAAANAASATTSTNATTKVSTQTSVFPANPAQSSAWSCDTYYQGKGLSTSTHIDVNDSGSDQIIQYMQTDREHCSEATVVGPAKFSADETRLAQLS